MHCLQNSLRSLPLGSGARKEETVSMLPLLLEANIDLTINEEGAAAASRVREEETQVVPGDPLLIRKWNGTLISETGSGRKNFL